jgi:hypothetical protein
MLWSLALDFVLTRILMFNVPCHCNQWHFGACHSVNAGASFAGLPFIVLLMNAYFLCRQRDGTDLKTLARRFWKVAAPYWWSEDKVQARLQLAAVFALTLATTGISVGFNFLGRDFYNALAGMSRVLPKTVMIF